MKRTHLQSCLSGKSSQKDPEKKAKSHESPVIRNSPNWPADSSAEAQVVAELWASCCSRRHHGKGMEKDLCIQRSPKPHFSWVQESGLLLTTFSLYRYTHFSHFCHLSRQCPGVLLPRRLCPVRAFPSLARSAARAQRCGPVSQSHQQGVPSATPEELLAPLQHARRNWPCHFKYIRQ